MALAYPTHTALISPSMMVKSFRARLPGGVLGGASTKKASAKPTYSMSSRNKKYRVSCKSRHSGVKTCEWCAWGSQHKEGKCKANVKHEQQKQEVQDVLQKQTFCFEHLHGQHRITGPLQERKVKGAIVDMRTACRDGKNMHDRKEQSRNTM
eukprot:1151365-Pelagomonas_calceolata.AAC.3